MSLWPQFAIRLLDLLVCAVSVIGLRCNLIFSNFECPCITQIKYPSVHLLFVFKDQVINNYWSDEWFKAIFLNWFWLDGALV